MSPNRCIWSLNDTGKEGLLSGALPEGCAYMKFAANNMTESERRELTAYINRRKFILLILSLFCVYLLINVISIRVRLYKQKQQLNLIMEQIEIAQKENDELRHMLSGTEAEYIERIAREKLGLAYKDEIIFKAADSE